MHDTILDIQTEPLSAIIASFSTCRVCGFATGDLQIALKGHPCEHCGAPSKGGILLFGMGVLSMVDLMQELYHLKTSEQNRNQPVYLQRENHLIAIVVFFCSLGEILLEGFLRRLIVRLGLPERVEDELMSDFSINGRIHMFEVLTGRTFTLAVKELDAKGTHTCRDVFKFYLDARSKRNHLLHAGNVLIVDESLPRECLLQTPKLLALFVGLHNKYIALPRTQTA